MANKLDLRRFRMLLMGSQIPFRDAYDFSPERGLKSLQRPYTVTHAGQPQLPTIVGVCAPLPAGEWEFFSEDIFNSGVLKVAGNPNYDLAGFHALTWYIEIEAKGVMKRLKSYGAGDMTQFRSEGDDARTDVWAFSLAISAAELLASRIPWSERLELQPVDPGPDSADLLAIP